MPSSNYLDDDTEPPEKIQMDVIGVCTSREVVEYVYNKKYVINKKIQLHTTQMLVSSDFIVNNPINYCDLEGVKHRHTILMELNKTAIHEISFTHMDIIRQ